MGFNSGFKGLRASTAITLFHFCAFMTGQRGNFYEIILVSNQRDAQFILRYVYLNPLEVSSNSVLIRRMLVKLVTYQNYTKMHGLKNIKFYKIVNFLWNNNPSWARVFSLSRLHDYPGTHHTKYDSSGRLFSPLQRAAKHNIQKRQTSMPPAEFEPAVLASQRPQTHALDRAATGIGRKYINTLLQLISIYQSTWYVNCHWSLMVNQC